MIIYNNCKLYGLTTKRQLAKFLCKTTVSDIKKQNFFIDKIKPSVIDGKRLIEAPNYILKKMQKEILVDLRKLEIPDNIFSGVKGRNYVKNGSDHSGKHHFMKIDLSKFFPCITRDKVYRFYKEKFSLPSDLAEILTNLSTINIEKINVLKLNSYQKENYKNAMEFIKNNNIIVYNHLITGSRISPLLSYLINEEMFQEIQAECDKFKIYFSIYIDDMAFSSNKKISNSFVQKIYSIIEKHGYVINKEKTRIVGINRRKKITGVIIDKEGKLKCPKKLEYKLKKYNDEFKKNNFDNIKKLYGTIIVMHEIEPEKYKYLYKLIMKKYKEIIKTNNIKN